MPRIFQQFSHSAALPLAGMVMAFGLAGAAIAQAPAPAATAPATVSAAAAFSWAAEPALNILQIYDRLEAAGYRDLHGIKWSDGCYEVKARNDQGARVELDVDGRNGTVLRSRIHHAG